MYFLLWGACFPLEDAARLLVTCAGHLYALLTAHVGHPTFGLGLIEAEAIQPWLI